MCVTCCSAYHSLSDSADRRGADDHRYSCLCCCTVPVNGVPYAAFHWARRLVITTLPVGFSFPRKSEVVNATGKLVQIQRHRVSDLWRKWQTPYNCTIEAVIAECKMLDRLLLLFMAALRSRCGDYIFALWFLSFFFYSSSNLSRRRLDVYHTTSIHGVPLVRI